MAIPQEYSQFLWDGCERELKYLAVLRWRFGSNLYVIKWYASGKLGAYVLALETQCGGDRWPLSRAWKREGRGVQSRRGALLKMGGRGLFDSCRISWARLWRNCTWVQKLCGRAHAAFIERKLQTWPSNKLKGAVAAWPQDLKCTVKCISLGLRWKAL